ncbi:MAG: dihydrolipoyllysine-residue succinyltransferase [Bdellovibrionaceae bacterium]|nr:dihydrolipoyllysine-residue succinyltransferase [Pseudobdellovibrionaceae bacterium]
MKHSVVAPAVGESITEVSILKWNKANGEAVSVGDVIVEIESDKATVEVIAENAGALQIQKNEGDVVQIGEVLATIDDEAAGASASAPPTSTPSAPTASASTPPPSPSALEIGPAARRLSEQTGINPETVSGTGRGGRVTKEDLINHIQKGAQPKASPPTPPPAEKTKPVALREGERRESMSRLRKKIAERLVAAQHTAAILTTFNEVDMKPVMDIRKQYKDAFKEKHGASLGFMSFFTRACVKALQEFPAVNASIDGDSVIYRDFQDVGVAVGTDKGLVVPVLKGAQKLSFAEIEKGILELALKARDGKLSIADMSGGTFTISNGGVYGSMLSTPILNAPQTGILGMHNIQQRPVVVDGEIVIRPMMYLALSYDHRLIDGKEAVSFLIKIKEGLENPENLGLDFKDEL